LVPILSKKFMDNLTPRLQRLQMRLMRFDFKISHTPGKELITADLLSRKPTGEANKDEKELEQEIKAIVTASMRTIPASTEAMSRIREAQMKSDIGKELRCHIKNGWPKKVQKK